MKLTPLRFLSIALPVAALVGAYFALQGSSLSELFDNRELLLERIRALGPLGPLLIIALMALAIVINPLPSAPIAMVAGAVYGHSFGTLYVVIGAEIGAIIAFTIARMVGYGLGSKYLGDTWSLGRFSSQNALMALVFVSRLIPFMSFDLISYAAGLTIIHFWRFALATLFGLLPVSFALAHMGAEIIDGDGLWTTLAILLIGLFTLVPLLLEYLRRRRKRHSGPRTPGQDSR